MSHPATPLLPVEDSPCTDGKAGMETWEVLQGKGPVLGHRGGTTPTSTHHLHSHHPTLPPCPWRNALSSNQTLPPPRRDGAPSHRPTQSPPLSGGVHWHLVLPQACCPLSGLCSSGSCSCNAAGSNGGQVAPGAGSLRSLQTPRRLQEAPTPRPPPPMAQSKVTAGQTDGCRPPQGGGAEDRNRHLHPGEEGPETRV